MDGPLRPLAPTGAPGVGDPPVSAHAVVEVRRRTGEDAAAAARRAFPWLSQAQVEAALAQQALDPAPLTPRVTRGQALSLGVALGTGMLLNATGVIGLLGIAWTVLMANLLELSAERARQLPGEKLLVFMFVGATACVVVGTELLRLQPWARYGAAALAFALVGVPAALAGEPPSAVAGGTFLCAQLAILGAVGRWTTPDGRAAARAVPTRPFVQVVAWGWLLATALLAFVPAFARLFKEVGVALGFGTTAILDVADVMTSYPPLQLLIPPVLLATSIPLLRLAPRHERPASWAVGVVGFAALGSIIGWLVLPVLELFEKL